MTRERRRKEQRLKLKRKCLEQQQQKGSLNLTNAIVSVSGESVIVRNTTLGSAEGRLCNVH